MTPYDDVLEEILSRGVWQTNTRTKKRCLTIFGMQKKYKLNTGYFPLVSRRKMWPNSIWAELLWIISGSTNIKDLHSMNCHIWDNWLNPSLQEKWGMDEGDLGQIYGHQLRSFDGIYNSASKNSLTSDECNGIDQLQYLIDRIKTDPSCRRILFSLWNPRDLNRQALAPCHILYGIFIDDEGNLSGMLTQRSADFPVGVPQNIAEYSALTMMIAQQTGYNPYEFIHSTMNSHIYEDQIPLVEKYLKSPRKDSPQLVINKPADIFSYKLGDFLLLNYNCGEVIKFPVAI